MPLDLATYEARVDALLQADAGLVSDPNIQDGIRRALETYSDDVPQELVADDNTADGATFDFDLPTGFVVEWSQMIAIEVPAGERQPVFLDSDQWVFYRNASTTVVRFLFTTPGTGDTVRFTFTALHTIDGLDGETATTIPSYHAEIFAKLAGAEALDMYAARYIHEQENALGADTVDRAMKTDEARRLAKAWREQYRDEIGKAGGVVPASGIADWDTHLARSGLGLLTHRRR